MFVLGNFIFSIAVILRIVINFEIFSIILVVVMSWLLPGGYSSFRIFFETLGSFVVKPLRKILPELRIGPVDLMPFIAILVLIFLDQFLVTTLFDLAELMR